MSAVPATSEHQRALALFGSTVRILVGPPAEQKTPDPRLAALHVETVLRLFQSRLSRFEPNSELSRLNAAPDDEVEVSPLLARAVSAAVWAAERSDGLVDPTLLPALERAGYAASRAGVPSAPLRDALPVAPPRRPGRRREDSRWEEISVAGSLVRRPAGLRLDLGGSAKGLAADVCGERLGGYSSFAVDVGGDIRIGGTNPGRRVVEVEHPLRASPAWRFALSRGAVATSGLDRRLWRSGGGFAHHLIDPATGTCAWTGVIQATAVAPSALEAEVLAKAGLLSGPDAGLRLLEPHGGILVLDDGSVLATGALSNKTEAAA